MTSSTHAADLIGPAQKADGQWPPLQKYEPFVGPDAKRLVRESHIGPREISMKQKH
jgi:hypothetical protein